MKKVCLITVWMGSFSDTFPLWLNTVKRNSTIDFYIVTDQDTSRWQYDNVFWIKSSLDEVRAIFEKNIGMKVRLKHAYKLCDFKPVWWMLIGDKLQQYDFYGVCDVDLLFGDIRHFVTDELLDKYNCIFDCGYLLIYKNEEQVRNLYRRSIEKDNMAYPYTKAFKTDFACYFDEFMGLSILKWKYMPGLVDQTKEDYLQDFSWKRLDFNSYITHKSFIFHWENGHVYEIEVDKEGRIIEELTSDYRGKEFLLVHIQKRKMEIEIDMNNEQEMNDFWIYPNKYAPDRPEGVLYTEEDCRQYAEMIRVSDKQKQLKRLKDYGIIQYIPHFLRSRKIKKFIRSEKGYF